jgi:8-oxo-dGTP pyrophosphatase MutT (NUDIX family)
VETVYRDTVAAYIVSADGKVLFGRKDPARGGVYADCWHVPGGGIDDGESREQALVREIYEEVGIDIANAPMLLVPDTGRGESMKQRPGQADVLVKMTFAVYRVMLPTFASQTRLASNDDLVDLTWFSLNELQDLQLTPPARAYIDTHGTDWLTIQQ